MYSIIIVFITIIIRELTDNVDGVLYAIMFASMFVPMINAKSGMYKLKTRLIIWLTTALFICGFTVFVTTQITHDLDMTKNQVEYYKGGIYE
jgi:Na+-translocating ferredoxin:NAD+ oxidoreductase RnfD subunit